MINQRRLDLIQNTVDKRQHNLTVVLENVHDAHNIGAVVRTCECVGIYEVILLYTHAHLQKKTMKIGKRTSAGARKWVDVIRFNDAAACFVHIRKKYKKVYSTHIDSSAQSVYEMDLTESCALIFGNEKEGISSEVLEYTDGNILIPQMGMVQSLNISVACSIVLYEAYRQRAIKGCYGNQNPISSEEKGRLLDLYMERHESKHRGYEVLLPEQDQERSSK